MTPVVAAVRVRSRASGGEATPDAGAGILHWLSQVLAWLVILAVAAVLVVAVLIPRIGGATPYTILTGSMKPGMPPGTLVVTKPVPVKQIGVGDVVTYQLVSGRPDVVTHRVVAVHVDARGRYTFTTKGDANNVADAHPVRPVQIRGERWYDVRGLGYVNTLVSDHARKLVETVVVCGLLGYAGWMFLGAARDRRGKRDGS